MVLFLLSIFAAAWFGNLRDTNIKRTAELDRLAASGIAFSYSSDCIKMAISLAKRQGLWSIWKSLNFAVGEAN